MIFAVIFDILNSVFARISNSCNNGFILGFTKKVRSPIFFKIVSPSIVKKYLVCDFSWKREGVNAFITCWIVTVSGILWNRFLSLICFKSKNFVLCFQSNNFLSLEIEERS